MCYVDAVVVDPRDETRVLARSCR